MTETVVLAKEQSTTAAAKFHGATWKKVKGLLSVQQFNSMDETKLMTA